MDPKLAELIERVTGKVVTGTVIAGAVIALAVYMRPGPPRYQIVASGNAVIRLNTESGMMIACTTRRCVNLHRPGGHIETRATLESLSRRSGRRHSEPAPPTLPAPEQ